MKPFCILIVILALGCNAQDDLKQTPAAYVAFLSSLDLDPVKYASYDKYYTSVIRQMQKCLAPLKSPKDLKTVFYKCLSILKNSPETPQGKSDWVNPYEETLNLVMYQLAKIQSAEAAKIMVDLYCDPKVGWDAGPSELAGDAIVRCGKQALPFLEQRKDLKDKDRLSRYIELIKSGAATGI